jgi:hypothetical protein
MLIISLIFVVMEAGSPDGCSSGIFSPEEPLCTGGGV